MSPTPWYLKADYLENCNCDLLCPCLFAVKHTAGDCNVPIAYHIREGHYGDVRLDDLTSENGVRIQVYVAIIASLLISLCVGRPPTKRNYERLCFYRSGWASEAEVIAHINRLHVLSPPTGKK